MSQRWPPPKPRLAQAEFDEAVKTNIEDFDMGPEEAVKSAVEEFQLQGYDLTGVFKSAEATDMEQQPLAVATKGLEEALPEESTSELPVDAIAAALDKIFKDLNIDESKMQEVLAVALKSNTLKAVLHAVDLLSKHAAASGEGASKAALQLALQVAQQLMMGSLELRDCFDDLKGHVLVMDLLERHAGDIAVLTEVTAVSQAAALAEEQNKEKLTEAGVGVALIGILCSTVEGEAEVDASSTQLILNTCGALRGLVTADDDRPPGSCCFKNARTLAGKHEALQVLQKVLHRVSNTSPELCNAILLTIKGLAANEEICVTFSEEGGIFAMLGILKKYIHNREVVRCCAQALRQLSIADPVKKELAGSGALEIIFQILEIHSEAADVLEPTLAVLANMTLRLPDIVAQAVEAGAIEALMTLMGATAAMGPVQRQLCIIVRNMVVRNNENRPAFLSAGAEEMIREAKVKHPKICKDVGYAALRDLGLENYMD